MRDRALGLEYAALGWAFTVLDEQGEVVAAAYGYLHAMSTPFKEQSCGPFMKRYIMFPFLRACTQTA